MESLNVRVSQVCVRVRRVRVSEWETGGGRGGRRIETGYVGNNTKHKKKVSHDLKHRADLFGLRKNLLHVVWRGECFPSLLSACLRHNTWKHFLRGHGSVKKKAKPQTFYFFSLFSTPLPPSAPPSFKLIELHTSARHMSKYPFNEYTAMRSGIVTCDYEIC